MDQEDGIRTGLAGEGLVAEGLIGGELPGGELPGGGAGGIGVGAHPAGGSGPEATVSAILAGVAEGAEERKMNPSASNAPGSRY